MWPQIGKLNRLALMRYHKSPPVQVRPQVSRKEPVHWPRPWPYVRLFDRQLLLVDHRRLKLPDLSSLPEEQ